MSNYKIIEKEEISGVEVLTKLQEITESKEEPTYREEKTIEFLKQDLTLDLETFNKIKEEIKNLEISRLENYQIIKIVELNPKNGTQLRAILSSSGTLLVDENVQKVLKILKDNNLQ